MNKKIKIKFAELLDICTPVYINGKILTNVCGYATIHGDSKYIFERIKKEFK